MRVRASIFLNLISCRFSLSLSRLLYLVTSGVISLMNDIVFLNNVHWYNRKINFRYNLYD